MRQRRFPTASIAILAALALGAGIASAPSVAFAQTTAAPEAGTITTELQPGWNMVGWVGPETLTGRFFEELPALRRISAWDAEEQRYRQAWPHRSQDLPRLMPGTGLLLFIRADTPVEWTRPIGPDGALQRLRPGFNLVGWTGDDGTPAGEALDRLGAVVIAAWDWDASSGQYATYDLSARGAASTPLRRGDAFWIQLSEAVNWWQPGTAEPPITFLGDVPDSLRRAIRSEYENVQRFFAERFGVVTRGTPIYIGADERSVRAIHLELFGRGPEEGFCGQSTEKDVYVAVLRCATPNLLGLDGRHLSVLLTPGDSVGDPGGSDWMIRGTEEYSHTRYRTAGGSGRYDTSRLAPVRDARGAGFSLRSVELRDQDADSWRNGQIDALTFLAVEWLAARAGDPAIIEYFHLLPSSGTWQEAFAAAFGITVEDFYTEFEAYRQEAAPPLPHLADDRSQPVIEWVGEVPADAREEISTDFERVRAFVSERFEAEPREFTLYVGRDLGSLRAVVPLSSTSIAPTCGFFRRDIAIISMAQCGASTRQDIYYIQALLPGYNFPPQWLEHGAEEYVTTEYHAEATALDLDDHRAWLRDLASQSSRSLQSRETREGVFEAGFSATRALGYFAVKWLVERAGEPALFDFYEQQPTDGNWRRPFRAAFGISVEDFYEEFEAARAALVPGAGVAPTPATVPAESLAAPEAGTITTELQPGWNMVGWVGPEMLTGRLFEELPALRRIAAWDAEEQRYRAAWPHRSQDLPRLMPGTGLLLFIRADTPVEWTRPIGPDGALQRLHPGLNLVGWTGEDGTPAGEALDRLGAALITAWDWDASSGKYATYDLSASGAASTPLRRGHAFWIKLSAPLNWWQPGTAEPPITFLGDVPDRLRMNFLAVYENVQAFFAERFAVVAPANPVYVGADAESVRSTYLAVFGDEPPAGFCGSYSEDHVYVVALRCADPLYRYDVVDPHTDALLTPERSARSRGGPEWMTRGTERYVELRYRAEGSPWVYAPSRRGLIVSARQVGLPLRSFHTKGDEDTVPGVAIDGVSFLAVEWLAARAGDPAIFDYYRLLRSADTWEEAFAAAFGITVEDFYAEFEAYRAEVAPPLPHITDDSAGPAIVFVGDVPADTQAAIRADIEKARAFVMERFAAELGEFTLYIGPDTRSIRVAVPDFDPRAICNRPASDRAAIALDVCAFQELHDIYPILAMVPTHDVPPRWLAYGAEEYATTAYRSAVKGVDIDSHLEWLRDLATRSTRSLKSRETQQGVADAGYSATRALGYFAVERLVRRAGEAALFDFYEQMPTHENWEQLFRTTFDISVRAFYEEFEASRARIIER